MVKKFSVHSIAKKKNINVFSVNRHSTQEVRNFIIENEIDYLLLGSSNWLIKKPILNINSCRIISIHPGLLPAYKGLDSLQWTIMGGGKIGNTAFFIDESLDGGEILKFYEEENLQEDTTAKIQRRMTAKKPAIYLDVLKGLKSKQIIPEKQLEGNKPFKPMSYEQLIEVEEIREYPMNCVTTFSRFKV